MKTRFLFTTGNETNNCGHHDRTCAKKCLQNCCPMVKANADNDDVFTKECQYCHEKVIIPFERHYVNDDLSTCKNILMKRKREALEKKEDKNKKWKRFKLFGRSIGKRLQKTLNKIKGWFRIGSKSENPKGKI